MNDLTVLFYTCNKVSEPFAGKVRAQLLRAIGDTPLISISHVPMDFGQNICVGQEIPPSTWNLYRQILIGAKAATTEYVAMAEDDMLAMPEHYEFRPPRNDTFYYSKGRWWLEKETFRYRPNRIVMGACIVNRELLIGALERRFAKFPNPPTTREEQTGWSEPGRYWWYWNLPKENIAYFHENKSTVLQVNHKCGLGGVRRPNESDSYAEELPYWGNAKTLYEELFSALGHYVPDASVVSGVSPVRIVSADGELVPQRD